MFQVWDASAKPKAGAHTHTNKQASNAKKEKERQEKKRKDKRNQQTRMQSRKTLVKQVFEQSCSLFHFAPLPYQCTIDCGMWKEVEGKVWRVKKVKC